MEYSYNDFCFPYDIIKTVREVYNKVETCEITFFEVLSDLYECCNFSTKHYMSYDIFIVINRLVKQFIIAVENSDHDYDEIYQLEEIVDIEKHRYATISVFLWNLDNFYNKCPDEIKKIIISIILYGNDNITSSKFEFTNLLLKYF